MINKIKSFIKRCNNRFVKWFELRFGWFFTNGNKENDYLEKYL